MTTAPVPAPGAGRTLLAAVAALAGGYLLAVLAAETPGLGAPIRIACALLAVSGFVVFIVAEVRVMRRLDELQQRIQLEALAVAFPTALVLVFALGMLERAGVAIWGFRQLRDVWPLVVLPLPIGYAIALRRYR